MGIFSFVQLVTAVTIVHAPCPTYHYASSCYDPSTQMIYISKRDERSRFVLLHEYGHAYDFQRLTNTQRESFKRLLGYPAARDWWQMGHRDKPGEVFADAYAWCALGFRPNYAKWLARICPLLPSLKRGLGVSVQWRQRSLV